MFYVLEKYIKKIDASLVFKLGFYLNLTKYKVHKIPESKIINEIPIFSDVRTVTFDPCCTQGFLFHTE